MKPLQKSMAESLKRPPKTLHSSSSAPQTLKPHSETHMAKKKKMKKEKKKKNKMEKEKEKKMDMEKERKKKNQFPSYLDAPHISHRARLLCEIIANTPLSSLESALSIPAITPYSDVVDEVLKLSYSHPEGAVKFFRWSGFTRKPTADSWNLIVDLLGRNHMFDQMWDAIRSMRQQDLLSKAAFVSAFESYCDADRISEVFMTFDVMENFGVEPDVAMVNYLLKAVVDSGEQIEKALEFFEKIKAKIPPDGDTFAAVFEALGRTNNVAKAKSTFGEMVVRLGWDSKNMPAYDAFLIALIRGGEMAESIKFFEVMKKKNCSPGLGFLTCAIDDLAKRNDSGNAIRLWDLMVVDGGGVVPDLALNNAMIGLLCSNNDIDNAFRLLDEMSLYGAFPDFITYNMIFECLVKNKKVREVGKFFNEMVKNECPPVPSNCAKAIEMLLNRDDPEVAVEIWNYMLENRVMPMKESANALLIGFCEMGRFSELKRSALEMLDRRIEIYESTMARLRGSYNKNGLPRDIYDSLHRRWRDPRSL